MKWEGFAYAAGAAVGHSCIDVSRKMAAQNFSPAELIALVGLLDALVLCALVWAFGSNSNIGSMESLFQTHDQSLLRILVISAGLKVMAGYMYQRALQVSPISVTVPYLAFTPVMLVFTSYFLMNEMPSFRGLLGVVVVTVGGYMLVVEKHGKITRGNQLEEGRVNHTGESFNISLGAETKKAFSVRSFFDWILSSHIFEPFLALRKEEGSLLMLAVAGVFSISNRLEFPRLNDLVYVHYNIRLWMKQLDKVLDVEAISLDNINILSEWRVESEAPIMPEAPTWLEEEQQQEEGEGEVQVESGDDYLDIIEADVPTSTPVPNSTQDDTSTPSSWRQAVDADVGPSSGKRAITFSRKKGRGH